MWREVSAGALGRNCNGPMAMKRFNFGVLELRGSKYEYHIVEHGFYLKLA